MIPFTSFFLPLFFLLLVNQIYTNTPTSVAATKSDIIQKTCERCTGDPNFNYTLCVKSLGSVAKSHHSDVRGLAVIAAKLARTKVKHTKSTVKKLLKAKPIERSMKNCLLTCEDIYSESASYLKDSIKAIKSGDYKEANVEISGAVDGPGDCEDCFQQGNVTSPLTKENDDAFGLAVIALAITVLLG